MKNSAFKCSVFALLLSLSLFTSCKSGTGYGCDYTMSPTAIQIEDNCQANEAQNMHENKFSYVKFTKE